MIKQKNLFLCVAIAFLTRTNLCWSSAVNQNEKGFYRKNYAAEMLSYMNISVDPCNDFYEYACGNWKSAPGDHGYISERKIYEFNDIVESILQRFDINDLAPEYAAEFKLAKQFYNNCMSVELIASRASSEYLKVLKNIGGFPAVEPDWKRTKFNWLKMSAHISNYGAKNLVKEDISTYYPFVVRYPIPDFGLSINLDNDTINDNSSNAYIANERIMRTLLRIYEVEKNNIDDIISQIFKFLKKILRFKQNFDEYWCEYISGLVNTTEIRKKWEVYDNNTWMGQRDYGYLCFYMYKQLDRIYERNSRAAANYLSLQFLYRMHSHPANIKELCLLRIKNVMIYFFDHLFMKLYFNDELRDELSYIVKEIRQSVRTIIKDAKWLDENTRKTALLKESKITVHVGRYEDTNYTKILLGELKKLHFINGSYEANFLNLCKFAQYMKRFGRLNYENFEDFGYTTKFQEGLIGMQNDINNIISDNTIYLMAGYLTPRVYNQAWPNSLKYGALGSLIGEQLMLHFNRLGANYNEKCRYRYWWSNKSENAFDVRAECFVNHYKKYFIPEINRYFNGEATNDENIADDGGLRAALMAYRRLSSNKEEERFGTHLSPEQLFFLSFAQSFCSSYTKEDYLREIDSRFAIKKFRVLGALSNNSDFAKAYNCTVGSKMNPTSSKCEMWS